MSKSFSCAICYDECRKRDVVCAKCWNGLSQARKDAIRLGPYSREEKARKLLNELLLCEEVKLKAVLEGKKNVKKPAKVEEELEAVYTEINAGKQ